MNKSPWIDLRHIQTGIRLTPSEVIHAQHDALCARTERRQREAKAALERRGVTPKVAISQHYVPPSVARQFQRVQWIRGAA
jgi:hypothetical protein